MRGFQAVVVAVVAVQVVELAVAVEWMAATVATAVVRLEAASSEVVRSEVASSDVVRSEVASSVVASSEVASSEVASSEVASSEVASSEVVHSEVARSEVAAVGRSARSVSTPHTACTHRGLRTYSQLGSTSHKLHPNSLPRRSLKST